MNCWACNKKIVKPYAFVKVAVSNGQYIEKPICGECAVDYGVIGR
jgi:hypothetical protein